MQKPEPVKKEPVIPPVTPQPQAPVVSHQSSTQPQILSGLKNGSIQASSYVPVVEDISPTPEDQKENSNLQ